MLQLFNRLGFGRILLIFIQVGMTRNMKYANIKRAKRNATHLSSNY